MSSTRTTAVPPFGKDRLIHGWVAVKAVSEVGDAAWLIAVAWTAVHVASPAFAGVVVAAGTIPRAVVLLLGGALADRLPVRRTLAVVTLARLIVLGVTLAVGMVADVSAVLLMGVAIAFGVCDAFFEPATVTLGRQLVRPGDLASYAALSQAGNRLGSMAGAAAGGVLVAAGGLAAAAILNAVTYAAVLCYLGVLVLRFPLPRAGREPVLRSIAGGFGYLGRDPQARTLTIALSGLNLFVGPALGLGLALRVDRAGWSPSWLGVFEALGGLGAVLGALAVLRRRPRSEVAVGFGLLVVQGVAIAAMALGWRPVIGLSALVIGITAGAASALLSAVFQRVVAADHLGRVASIQRLGDDVLMPAAMAGFGALAAAASLEATLLLFGGAMAVLMALSMARLRSAPRVEGHGSPGAAVGTEPPWLSESC